MEKELHYLNSQVGRRRSPSKEAGSGGVEAFVEEKVLSKREHQELVKKLAKEREERAQSHR